MRIVWNENKIDLYIEGGVVDMEVGVFVKMVFSSIMCIGDFMFVILNCCFCSVCFLFMLFLFVLEIN